MHDLLINVQIVTTYNELFTYPVNESLPVDLATIALLHSGSICSEFRLVQLLRNKSLSATVALHLEAFYKCIQACTVSYGLLSKLAFASCIAGLSSVFFLLRVRPEILHFVNPVLGQIGCQ